MNRRITLVVLDGQAKTSRVNALVSPDEESTEDGLSEEVEYAIEDSLGIGGNEISTLADTPGNWVEDPWSNLLASVRRCRENRYHGRTKNSG